ncbi:MAG TPA: hypothetical protein VGX68_08600 [Thermoanaerobaculia bacterium]|nr:hypothetical protein [Thermoanaerobaculia bacterium]
MIWQLLSASIVTLALAVMLPDPSLARKNWRPPSREEVAQVWIGWSTDELYFLRLELFPNGEGLGCYVFLEEKPEVFRIASWRYDAGRIKIYPVSPAKPSWVVPLEGSIIGLPMKLSATGRDWKLSFLLRREADYEDKIRQLKLEMARVRD